ncbi:helix-turn-helix domain-containing protein [Sporosarcina siberiensis]|uniref:Helix-turn-helix domain-containing protein n=1 Tax=Sporosarcina siberiensis TaxID=1365606 RepID=A0ABW4SL67_9BACL
MAEKTIGEKIKTLRKNKKLTLKDLANGTDLSISFLSQVERMQSSLTLESLKKISDALGVNPSYFFQESKKQSQSSIVRSIMKEEDYATTEFIYRDLSGNNSALNFSPILVVLKPGGNRGNPFSHRGFEFIYVLDGMLTVEIDTVEHQLYSNDSIVIDSKKPHYWWNRTNDTVRFLCVSSEKN